jgi:hypothetical protein
MSLPAEQVAAEAFLLAGGDGDDSGEGCHSEDSIRFHVSISYFVFQFVLVQPPVIGC